MYRLTYFLTVVLLLVHIAVLSAQQPQLEPGARVRITAPDSGLKARSGVCVALTNGVMDFTADGEPNTSRLDMASVSKFEVSTGRKSYGAGKAAVLGMLAGAGVGAILQQTICTGTWEDSCGNELLYFWVAFGGAMWAVMGAKKTERWEEVPLDRLRVSVAPIRDRRFALGFSMEF